MLQFLIVLKEMIFKENNDIIYVIYHSLLLFCYWNNNTCITVSIGRASLAELYLLTRLWYSKNASFNSFLLYRPGYCSEIHAFSYCSNENYRYNLK